MTTSKRKVATIAALLITAAAIAGSVAVTNHSASYGTGRAVARSYGTG
jgi:hypothetical protein